VHAQALTGQARNITVSVGAIALEDCTAATPESDLAAADLAMYDAKAVGSDNWACYAEPRITVTPWRAAVTATFSSAHTPALAITWTARGQLLPGPFTLKARLLGPRPPADAFCDGV